MSGSVPKDARPLRRSVPNDNDCLFSSIGYLCEAGGAKAVGRGLAGRLRRVVSERIAADAENIMFSEAVLGMAPAAYQAWIQNHFNWGGETEIFVLSTHYDVEISVVSCEGVNIITYNEGADKSGRIYILYTGQHYDPLVGVAGDGDAGTKLEGGELKLFPAGFRDLDGELKALAAEVAEEQRKKLLEKRVKRIKCNGCGHLCDDPEAFQLHCFDEAFADAHGDDFDYMCEEVEVVLSAEEAEKSSGMPDFSNTELVHTFYDLESEPLSNKFLCDPPIVVGGVAWPTVQHVDFAAKFVGAEAGKGVLEAIRTAATTDEARAAAYSVDDSHANPSFGPEAREERLRAAIYAKFGVQGEGGDTPTLLPGVGDAVAALRQRLLDTGDKYVAQIGDDKWTGVQALGGVPQGKNNVGKILMETRDHLKKLGAASG
uniref:Ubiquitin thioesterase OTU n=1 Tax=Phaeomonas parva TaxID=124430 RepID=A0A7S1UIY4_9STRA